MYLGHVIYMIGVAVLFQSWIGAAIVMARAVWFHFRVLRDDAASPSASASLTPIT